MNWDALGAISEFLGALAVLATLLYLAVQVRHSRLQLEKNEKIALGQIYQSRSDMLVNQIIPLLDPSRYADAQLKLDTEGFDSLTNIEKTIIKASFQAQVIQQDCNLRQAELGLIDEELESLIRVMIARRMPVWKQAGVRIHPRVMRHYNPELGGGDV